MSIHPEPEKLAPPPYDEEKDQKIDKDSPIESSPPPEKEDSPISSPPVGPPKEFLSRPTTSITNTGPTSYPSSKFALYFVNAVLLIQFVGRGLCGLLIVFDPDIRARSLYFAILFAIVYLAAGLYIFFLSFMEGMPGHKHHMTLRRFHFTRLLRTRFLYIFLVDQLVILLLLYTSKWAFSDFSLLYNIVASKSSLLFSNKKSAALMFLMNAAGFLVLTRFEVSSHEPCSKMDHLYYSISCVEDSESGDNQLRILESRAFWIIIANVGQKPVEGNLLIIRKVTGFEEPVAIPLFLAEPLNPGAEITLVPETKSIPGACKIPHFRSFGRDKGEIETRIYVEKKSKKYSIRRLEKFEGDSNKN